MAIEPAPDTLLRLHTQLNVVRARTADLQVKVRRRQVVEVATLKAAAVARGYRARDQMVVAPARHAAVFAAGLDIEPAAVAVALDQFARAALREISTGPGRQRLAAEIARQRRPPP